MELYVTCVCATCLGLGRVIGRVFGWVLGRIFGRVLGLGPTQLRDLGDVIFAIMGY